MADFFDQYRTPAAASSTNPAPTAGPTPSEQEDIAEQNRQFYPTLLPAAGATALAGAGFMAGGPLGARIGSTLGAGGGEAAREFALHQPISPHDILNQMLFGAAAEAGGQGLNEFALAKNARDLATRIVAPSRTMVRNFPNMARDYAAAGLPDVGAANSRAAALGLDARDLIARSGGGSWTTAHHLLPDPDSFVPKGTDDRAAIVSALNDVRDRIASQAEGEHEGGVMTPEDVKTFKGARQDVVAAHKGYKPASPLDVGVSKWIVNYQKAAGSNARQWLENLDAGIGPAEKATQKAVSNSQAARSVAEREAQGRTVPFELPPRSVPFLDPARVSFALPLPAARSAARFMASPVTQGGVTNAIRGAVMPFTVPSAMPEMTPADTVSSGGPDYFDQFRNPGTPR